MPDETLLPDALPPEDPDRRLFRRYPAGLAAELLVAGEVLPCRISDISLGGACVELDSGVLAPSLPARLRSAEIACGQELAVEIRRILTGRVHLAFHLDEQADHELTLFLMHNPATQDGLEPAA